MFIIKMETPFKKLSCDMETPFTQADYELATSVFNSLKDKYSSGYVSHSEWEDLIKGKVSFDLKWSWSLFEAVRDGKSYEYVEQYYSDIEVPRYWDEY